MQRPSTLPPYEQSARRRTGVKKTGGRQKGTPNKATVERDLRAATGLKAATLDGLLPLDVMIARMKNEALPNGSMVTDDQLAAAIAAAPYVHPKLAASVFKGEIEGPIAVKLSLDYSRLELHEMTQLLALVEKTSPRAEENEPLMIEGEVEDGGGAFGAATGR